ncbi:DNA-3-methyladenine glycosylase 2 family protein [soil metagenome]
MIEDFERCYRAVQGRDPRFDGWFVTAVTSTGIYCRPSCPAVTPNRANVVFHATAASAQHAGFRACRRCRPDATPGSPEWNVRGDLVGRAMRLIADGVVDREGVPDLAGRLGYSTRHLHRQLVAEVGAGPLALARAQRAQTARVLIETTALTFADVAFAAGFSSVRQFNDTVRAVFATTPRRLRQQGTGAGTRPRVPGTLTLRLPYRPHFAAEGLFAFLSMRAVPGIEHADGDGYRRTLALPHGPGVVGLRPAEGHIRVELRLTDLRDLATAVARCRRLLDLDADPTAIDGDLGRDPILAPLVRRSPGRRVPGAVAGGEMAVRAVLGQQVSVAGARTLAGRLVARYGKPLTAPDGALTHAFPDPDAVAGADLAELGLPRSRQAALRAIAIALASGDLDLDAGADRVEAERRLLAIPGIGPWTASYVAMRALADPDAFPATDLGVRRAFERQGRSGRPADVLAAAERWRPWRAYATHHLWNDHAPKEKP